MITSRTSQFPLLNVSFSVALLATTLCEVTLDFVAAMLSYVFVITLALLFVDGSYVPWPEASEYEFIYEANLRTIVQPSTEPERISDLSINGHISVVSTKAGLLVQIKELVKETSKGDSGPWTSLHMPIVSRNRTSMKPFLISYRDGTILLPETSLSEPPDVTNLKRAIASELAWFINSTELHSSLEKQRCGQGCAQLQMVLPLNKANSGAVLRNAALETRQMCGKRSILEVNQVTDFEHCDMWPVFNVIVPPAWRCHPGTPRCEDTQQLVSANQLLGCFSDTDFFPLTIRSHHIFTIRPIGILQHSLHIVTDQQFTLASIKRSSSTYSGALAFVPDPDLNYRTFKHHMLEMEMPLSSHCKVEGVRAKWLALPRNGRHHNAFREFRDMLRLCRQEEFRWLITHAPNMHAKETLMMATLAAGTQSAIEFAIETIVQRTVPMKWTQYFFSSIPFYLRVPSISILVSLIDLLERFEPHSGPVFWTGLISVASVLRAACFEGGPATVRFPSTLYGSFCDGTDNEITQRFLTLLFKKVQANESQENQAAALRALNVMGHQAVVPMVVKALRGEMSTDAAFRERAVLALHKLAHRRHPETRRILKAVFFNLAEEGKVRLAAYTLLMLSNPDYFELQSIASQTWHEIDTEVLPFVTSGIASFTKMRTFLGSFNTISKKSVSVLSLLKQAQTGRHSANSVFSYIERANKFAFYGRLETFMTANKPFMEDVYGRLNFNFGAFDFDLLEFSVHLNGYGETAQELLQRIAQFYIARKKQAVTAQPPSKPYALWYPKDSYTLNHITWVETYERFSKFVMDFTPVANFSKIKTFEANNVAPVIRLDIRFLSSLGFIQMVQIDGLASVSYGITANSLADASSQDEYFARISMSVESSVSLCDGALTDVLKSGTVFAVLGNFSTSSQRWEEDIVDFIDGDSVMRSKRVRNTSLDVNFQTFFNTYARQGNQGYQTDTRQRLITLP